MNQASLDALRETGTAFRLPRWSEIPDVGLYLEQTVKYLNGFLSPAGDLSLTASMVSNYVKMKLLDNPVRKQYNRSQISRLILIALAKTVLSLDSTRLLLSLLQDFGTPEEIYVTLCAELESAVRAAFLREAAPEQLSPDAPDALRLLRYTMQTVAGRLYLDRYLSLVGNEGH